MKKKFRHIAIIGLGLIGGSLAAAVRKNDLAGRITAYGRSRERLGKAQALGLIDGYETSFAKGLGDADLVVVGTPVSIIARQVREAMPFLSPGTLVTDVGSVKGPIVAEIESFVPEGVFYVGGHPIAGTENSGFEASFPELFENRACILTPTAATSQESIDRVGALWTAAGSRVVHMDVKTHDTVFAAVSHLPHMVAFALVNALVDLDDDQTNLLQYAAGGFKDFTRIAASDPVMWRDIAVMNRGSILAALASFERSLAAVKQAVLESDEERLEALFQKSHDTRRNL